MIWFVYFVSGNFPSRTAWGPHFSFWKECSFFFKSKCLACVVSDERYTGQSLLLPQTSQLLAEVYA